MNALIEWFARNHVASNLLMLGFVVGGLLTVPRTKMEVFPELQTETITVSVEYLGASPEEVEEGVITKIEEAVQGLEFIDEITSVANENFGTVTIDVLTGTDMQKALDDVNSQIDAITTFPDEAEEPEVKEVSLVQQTVNVAVWGDVNERVLKKFGEQVRDEVAALDGITYTSLANARPYEISIEVSEEDLRKYGLTFDMVAQRIQSSSLDLPGGAIDAAGGEILLRTKGQAYVGGEFEQIPLLTQPNGQKLLLGDIATVIDGFEEVNQKSRFNGKPAVLVKVFRVGDQNAIELADAVGAYVEEMNQVLPEGINLTVWQDESIILIDRISLLVRNGLSGLALVFLVLALFLQFRLAIWVSLGIPISFLGTFLLLPQVDVSISMISTFAFIIVLGIVVDDAIVVGENIFQKKEAGLEGDDSAVEGAQEVGVPVFFAVMTTVAAFSPLAMVPGPMGQIWAVIPYVVILTLLFSLVESQLILPAHLAHVHLPPKNPRGPGKYWLKFQGLFTGGLRWLIENTYLPVLKVALRVRYITVAVGIFIVLATVGLVVGGYVKFVFFPPVDDDQISAALTMPLGTPPEQVEAALTRIEQAALTLQERYAQGVPEGVGSAIRNIQTSIGSQPFMEEQSGSGSGNVQSFDGDHRGEVVLELVPTELRDVYPFEISSKTVEREWRELVGDIPDAQELTYTASIFSAGEAINFRLTAPDFETLTAAAEDLKAVIATYPGTYEISDTFLQGKRELKLRLKPEAETLNVTLADLARQVRAAFYGLEAQRVQRGRDDIRVMVRYPEEERQAIGDLENLRIRTMDGQEIPFSQVAEVEYGRGFASIERVNRKRALNVTAQMDLAIANPTETNNAIVAKDLPRIMQKYRGLEWSFAGEQKEQAETLEALQGGFIMAMLVIYALLAIPFESYIQPLIVMSAIPFGLVGAIWGHVLMGHPVSMLSLCGIVALAGVVVNDSLVLVDYINRRVREGIPVLQAVLESGQVRFRPIILTSLTTFFGLLPLLLEKSVQAQFLIPMGISLGYGVLFATFIILLIVPSLYLILGDMVKAWGYLHDFVHWVYTGERRHNPHADKDFVAPGIGH